MRPLVSCGCCIMVGKLLLGLLYICELALAIQGWPDPESNLDEMVTKMIRQVVAQSHGHITALLAETDNIMRHRPIHHTTEPLVLPFLCSASLAYFLSLFPLSAFISVQLSLIILSRWTLCTYIKLKFLNSSNFRKVSITASKNLWRFLKRKTQAWSRLNTSVLLTGENRKQRIITFLMWWPPGKWGQKVKKKPY